ncbi:MAG: YeeE/YedE family protein [Melioribacteraceae bacterium]|nr:YeeE/YedE family protein [Melioribacteraceae bacterium]
MSKIASTILGITFGFILTKSEVISWFRIQKMFRFEEPYMYLIIGTAVIVGIISVQILKRFGLKSIAKEELDYSGKILNKGTVLGGIIFGIGWAITGACPGPIFAQIGSGEYAAVSTLVGALSGSYLFNLLKSKLP